MTAEQEQQEIERLAKRSERCAALCAEMSMLDFHGAGSPEAKESNTLSELVEFLTKVAAAGFISMPSAMRLMDLVFTLQEEAFERRKAFLRAQRQ